MNAAVAWLEDRYEAIAGALASARAGIPLTDGQRDALREARAADGDAPPRPRLVFMPRMWRWQPGDEPGPLDGRAHP